MNFGIYKVLLSEIWWYSLLWIWVIKASNHLWCWWANYLEPTINNVKFFWPNPTYSSLDAIHSKAYFMSNNDGLFCSRRLHWVCLGNWKQLGHVLIVCLHFVFNLGSYIFVLMRLWSWQWQTLLKDHLVCHYSKYQMDFDNSLF